MSDLLRPFRLNLVRQTFAQVFLVLIIQMLILAWHREGTHELITTAVLSMIAGSSWWAVRRSEKHVNFYVGMLEFAFLIAPWTSGGLRHPAIFLALLLLHPLALFYSPRAVWAYAACLATDLFALVSAEMNGLIVSTVPSSESMLLTMIALCGYMIFFSASPLLHVRRLVDAADHHLQERAVIDVQLEAMEHQLEERVASRCEELLEARQALQSSARAKVDVLKPAIARLQQAIAGFAEVSEPSRALTRIQESERRIVAMQKALERFCRVVDAAPHRVEISADEHVAMVRSVWSELSDARPHQAKLDLEDLPGCTADPQLLRHVWQNLLSNAIKYSSHNPTPCVEVFHDEAGFHVRDNGVGFDPEHADQLFGLFHRLHKNSEFPGVGVGLAITHRIVEMHEGHMDASAVPGRGAMFSFSLDEYEEFPEAQAA